MKKLKENIVIHIPHASLKIPDMFFKYLVIDKDKIEKENTFLADFLVDKFIPENCSNVIKFEFSRMFCDVERFKDDKFEIMSKHGMGVVYEKDHYGNTFIKFDENYKNGVISKYYDDHHLLIDNTVERILNKHKFCYIIDLHSFSDEFVAKVLGLHEPPDICIGYDEEFCNMKLVKKTVEYFKSYGYSVMQNYPYSGSLIPNKYYNSNNSRVCSIMIEINKRIYLDENVTINFKKYSILKDCIDTYYYILNTYYGE